MKVLLINAYGLNLVEITWKAENYFIPSIFMRLFLWQLYDIADKEVSVSNFIKIYNRETDGLGC